jgi:penicillin G amidase
MVRIAALILTFVALAGGAAYGYLRQSLPQIEGEITLAGLQAPVEILRDRYGVPHVYAASVADAYFALGFLHAQDRLWQMEMSRRIAAGRLAEILGAGALETDRFLRTLGVRRVAEANLRHFDAQSRRVMDAYAAGVNAFLASGPVLPLEFFLFSAKPEPWSAADSVAWVKMMAWDLGANWRNELLRLQLARELPLARIHEFLAPYPGDVAPEIRDLRELYGSLEREPVRFAENGDFLAGSNSWALSGSRTDSGKPLLANDPHLGFTAPPVWYLAHLRAPGLDAIGGTLPGVPGVLAGRNERIAWGLTSTGGDVQDLYLEKRDAQFDERVEVIRIKGAPDERLTVRVSRHGPVISDVSRPALEAAPRGHVLALAWTALADDDLSAQAALKLAQASGWPAFLAALRDLHAPQQTLTYADVDGNIGMISAGRVPLRKPGNDLRGLAPAPGWEARYDWAGYIPFEELPRILNGTDAVIAANHKIVAPEYKPHITSEWQPPYRARRIDELLAAQPSHDLGSFARMQADVVSLAARELLPLFLKAAPRTQDTESALKMLAAWDGNMAANRPEPLIFTAWWREIARALYADELGGAFATNWAQRAVFVANALSRQRHWCDNVRTPAAESCEELLAESLERALADLRERYGDDWRWGEAHVARHRHRPLTRQGFLSRFFDIRVPSGGDAYTVNAGRMDFNDEAEPYASRHGASYRALYDLADPQKSLFIHSGGQSGNILSRHYRAFAEPWRRGEYVPMVSDRKRLEAAGAQRLVLAPQR